MNNGVEMKIDWSKITDYVEFVTVDSDGETISYYYMKRGILMWFDEDSYDVKSFYKNIDDVRKDYAFVIERPINYPNSLMKYIGCEVVLCEDENNQPTYVTDVGEDWILTKYNGVIVRVYTDSFNIVSLVNEDGSLVQLGKEDWHE